MQTRLKIFHFSRFSGIRQTIILIVRHLIIQPPRQFPPNPGSTSSDSDNVFGLQLAVLLQ